MQYYVLEYNLNYIMLPSIVHAHKCLTGVQQRRCTEWAFNDDLRKAASNNDTRNVVSDDDTRKAASDNIVAK